MLWTHVAAAVAAAALAFSAGWQVRAWKAGNDEAAQLRAAQVAAVRRAETAAEESAAHERTRAAITRAMRNASPAVQSALERPACPDTAASAPGLALGDVVVPAGALGRLRIASGADQPDAAATEPGAAVRPWAADPGR